jgi:hypothetical protein
MSEVFWVGLYTAGIAFLLALSRQLYKSKCQSLKCCGCELVRDVEAEEKIDELEIERHQEEKSIAQRAI